ncbi:MAG: type VI secretion system contractile sheath small subunit [Deltaproteobacteria bacterium]|jgi:type VI secretion system ImpB/VipA family protein|nr:type VI secretion system contractile sheath small subunit [Deltaproteobacteria bacterium]
MSENKSGSIVKERVAIVYKSSQSNQDVELPFKILLMGDFSRSSDNNIPLDQRPTIPITKENLDAALKGLSIKFEAKLKNHLAKEATEPLLLTHKFRALADFEPRRIIESCPPLAKINTLSQSLARAKKLLIIRPTVLEKLKVILKSHQGKETLLKEVEDYLRPQDPPPDLPDPS